MTDQTQAHEMHPSRWGDPAAAAPLPDTARGLIEMVFGIDERPAVESPALPEPALAPDLLDGLRDLLGPDHVLTDDETRRLRTRGKSTPDLLRARAGDLSDAPDAVVRPGGHDDVAVLLAYAVEHHLAVVPFGGGTSVTGGLAARREGYAGLVSLDLIRMKRLLAVDATSMTATLEPGLRGPEAEALLAEHDLTLGHYPQSFEYASIGGFAATRSSGQSSAGYGRFDSLVVGLTVATPSGRLDLGSAPANAAGPDLRQLILGSEGAFGVITSVTVRVRRLPEVKVYDGWRWPSFAEGAGAMRTLAQSGLLPTVIRLSDESETAINLARPDEIGGESAAGCMMIAGYEGTPAAVEAKRAAVTAVLDGLGGTNLGEEPGRSWAHGRFNAPYLRDSMLDVGVLVETLETATFWSNIDRLYADVKSAVERELGQPSLVLCHISHVYETGCSLYFTVAAKETDDPIGQWQKAKAAASDAMIDAGATITHHHAVGTDHKPWFAQEIGPVGVSILRAVKAELDPTGVLNPGVLYSVTRSFTFLVNPSSGGGAAAEAVVPVARLLRDAGAAVEVTYSPGPNAMRDLVAGALVRGDVVVSVGGDGMLSSLAGAVSGGGGTLAVLPAGRGNDFARMLGLPEDAGSQALLLLEGDVRRVDLLSWTVGEDSRLVAGSVYAGVDARASAIVDRAHWLPRSLQYPYAAVRSLATYQPGRYRVSVDGAEEEYSAATVVVANSAYYGKGMKIAPAASVDDGLLDVVVIEAASKVELLRSLPTVYDGAHVDRPEVTVLTGKRVEIRGRARTPIPVGGDGEPLGFLPGLADEPAVAEIQPGALQIIG